jgi:hypothetical protein
VGSIACKELAGAFRPLQFSLGLLRRFGNDDHAVILAHADLCTFPRRSGITERLCVLPHRSDVLKRDFLSRLVLDGQIGQLDSDDSQSTDLARLPEQRLDLRRPIDGNDARLTFAATPLLPATIATEQLVEILILDWHVIPSFVVVTAYTNGCGGIHSPIPHPYSHRIVLRLCAPDLAPSEPHLYRRYLSAGFFGCFLLPYC